MGTSGCGKTTAMEVVSDFRQNGAFRGARFLVGSAGGIKHHMQFVESRYRWRPGMTMREIIAHRLCFLNKTPIERAELFWRHVEELKLEEALETHIENCSDGQQRRLAIALGLTAEPK